MKNEFRSLILEKVPFIGLSIVSCIVTLFAQQNAIRDTATVSLPPRLANAAVAYLQYIIKMLLPVNLQVLYPLPESTPAWQWVSSSFFLVAVAMLSFAIRRRHPYFMVGWLWYLGTLVPVIGIVQVGNQAFADQSYHTIIKLDKNLAGEVKAAMDRMLGNHK